MATSDRPRGLIDRFWILLRRLVPAGGILVVVIGLFIDQLSVPWRLLVAALIVLAFVLGAHASRRTEQRARNLERERDRAIQDLTELRLRAPLMDLGEFLGSFAGPLFSADGGWRLSVYVLTEQPGSANWVLRRIARSSSLPEWEENGRAQFDPKFSFFRNIHLANLTHSRTPYFEEASTLPDREMDANAWTALQYSVIQDSAVVSALRMPTQKYAWCASRETEGQKRVVALMAESTDPSGISTDVLRSALMGSLLSMFLKLHDAPEAIESAIQIGERVSAS